MSGLLYADMSYCSICDRYFPGEDAKMHHIQISPNHPKCETCNKRFANKHALRNHLVCSSRHHYCAVCEQSFRTAAGLRAHLEFAAVHRDDTDDDDDDDDDDPSSDEPDIDFLFDYTEGGNDSSEFEGWEDTLGASVFPQENTQASEESTHISEYALERASDDVEDSLPLTAIDDLEEDEEDYWSEVVQEDEGDEEEEDDDTRGDLEDGNSNIYTTQDQSTSTLDILTSDIATETSQETNPLPSSTSSNPFSCPLCLDPPRACSATRCGHVFCTQCIHIALKNKKLCPVCRVPAFEKQLRKIYLPASV